MGVLAVEERSFAEILTGRDIFEHDLPVPLPLGNLDRAGANQVEGDSDIPLLEDHLILLEGVDFGATRQIFEEVTPGRKQVDPNRSRDERLVQQALDRRLACHQAQYRFARY